MKRSISFFIFPVFVFFLILFFYYPSLSFKYVNLDDTPLIANRITHLTNPANIFTSFKEGVMYWADKNAFYYRPVLTVSFVLDGIIFKDNFWGYHLSNIFYHFISVVLVFYLLLRFKTQRKVAYFLSVLFAIHPVFIQAVAWVPGRNDQLLLIFTIASLLYFVDYLSFGSFKDLGFYLFFFFLSVFTKETSLASLIIFALYYLMIFESKTKKSLRRFLLLTSLSFSVFFLWYFLARSFSDKSNSYLYLITHNNWLVSLSREIIPGYLVYIGKVFFPFYLSVFPLVSNNPLSIKLGIVFLGLIFLSLILFVKSSQKKVAIFGLLWFLVTLFPTLIKVMIGEPLIIYEHRLYLPMVGMFIFLSQLKFWDVFFDRKVLFSLSILVLISFCFYINRKHIYNFKDSLSFWEAAYSTSPDHFVTSVGLSGEYLTRGDFEKAESVFKNLDRIKPDSEISHLGFASLYYRKKEFEKSREELKKALEKNPKSIRARYYLASIEEYYNNYDKAEELYLEAININDDNIDLLMALMRLYVKENKIEEAKAIYQKVRDLGADF